MLAAGLLAKKAVERGLKVGPAVKSSLAPGSRVVTDYLTRTGLRPIFDTLGFQTVGYGCTTCIGNSGPLRAEIEDAVVKNDLVAARCSPGTAISRRGSTRASRRISSCRPRWSSVTLAGPGGHRHDARSLGKGKDGRDVFLERALADPVRGEGADAGGAQA